MFSLKSIAASSNLRLARDNYSLTIESGPMLGEVCLVLTTTVPVLLNTMKELHITLTRLACTASFDDQVLHKALEVVGPP